MILSCKNLQKNFGKKDEIKALKSIDFTIEKSGEILGLVGPDGAGKTTLIRLLTGLLAPSGGELEILSYKMPQTSSQYLKNIGYMPQKFGLYEDLSVGENLELYATLQNVQDKQKRVQELLSFTKLKEFINRKAGDLSGGMKQKLGLACALIKKPKLLLLDEPGVGVDPISRQELWAMVQELLDEDVSIIWATSYLDEANLCNKVILLNEGEILFYDKPKKVEKLLKNRVFLANTPTLSNKVLRTKLLEKDSVLDAYIVGDDVRFIIKKNITSFKDELKTISEDINLENITGDFEDAFVDFLGIKTQAHSKLALDMNDIQLEGNHPIIAKDLTKKFGNFIATNSVSFQMNKGEIFGILGPNGAGKSTTFKMFCGLLKPSLGSATILGEDLYNAGAKIKNQIGYMAQKFSLYGNLSLKDNLDFFAGIYGLKGNIKQQKIKNMIDIFNLGDYLNINAQDLPLGLKQRLALSCSVMHEPKVLFLDEATSGVDPITRKEFWTHINSMVEKGMSIVITTHLMNEAEYCDRLMLIYKGKAIAIGTPQQLKQSVKKGISMQDTFIELIKKEDKKNEL